MGRLDSSQQSRATLVAVLSDAAYSLDQPPIMTTTGTTWYPPSEVMASLQISVLMKEQDAHTFEQIHKWSVAHPDAFWERTVAALGITLDKPYTTMLDASDGVSRARWLVGARMNIAKSCFKEPRDRPAVITRRHDGRMEWITLDQLERMSNRVANGLKNAGVQKGDAVALDMAMTAEAVALYLGIVKMGGAAVSIPESFASEEIEKRLRIANTKAVFTQDVLVRGGKSLPIYEKVCKARAPQTIVFGSRSTPLRSGDLNWYDFLADDDAFQAESCAPQDTVNILFSSGTTGEPKAIAWDHTTPIKCASDALYHHDIKMGHVVCWPTSMGWMMGPWLIFASLLNNATIALYEGAPVERGFCEFVQDAKVNMLGIVPSIVKGWRQTGCADGLNWANISTFSSSGEASNARDYSWLMQLNQPAGITKPVIEYCGGTELGGGYLTNNLLTTNRPSEFNGKTMGIDFVVLNDAGDVCKPGETGELFIIPPSIGMSTRLLNSDNDKVYYSGCPQWEGKTLRRHGDQITLTQDGRYRSNGRADNTMNLGGIKVGSVEIENVVNSVAGVTDTAAIGIPPADGGPDRLIIFAVADKAIGREEIKAGMKKAIKERLNPLFHLHDVMFVDVLPRTASNKVMHRTLREQYYSLETRSAAAH
jgi:acetyl-CoA synthetase